jgi:hypothetical protein
VSYPDNSGGAVLCLGSSPAIRGCIFSNNTSSLGSGGAVFGNNSAAPSLNDCRFFENFSDDAGGAVAIDDLSGTLVVEQCVFVNNETLNSGGALLVSGGEVAVSGCVITGNRASVGGGLSAADDVIISVSSCTISGNFAGMWGGGLYLAFAIATFDHSILWGNCSVDQGNDAYLNFPETSLIFRCSALDESKIFPGGLGEVILDGPQVMEDPLFCEPVPCEEAPTPDGDYRLHANSPCLPGNSPNECGLIGALGEGCEPTRTIATTWGQIKAGYRD